MKIVEPPEHSKDSESCKSEYHIKNVTYKPWVTHANLLILKTCGFLLYLLRTGIQLKCHLLQFPHIPGKIGSSTGNFFTQIEPD